MYVSLYRLNSGSDNGLSPIRRQATIGINTGILWIGPLGTNFGEIQNTKGFFHENAFECAVCDMAAILSKGDESITVKPLI